MARIVLPLFGPLVPVMSSVRGFLDGSIFHVPSSGCLPTETVYLPSVITSVVFLMKSSGSGLPLASAVTGFQVPTSFLASSLASPPGASGARQTHSSTDQQNRRFTVVVLLGWSSRVGRVFEAHRFAKRWASKTRP